MAEWVIRQRKTLRTRLRIRPRVDSHEMRMKNSRLLSNFDHDTLMYIHVLFSR